MRGPIHYICRECGASNKIYEYVEFINCYACGTRMRSGEKWKAECKKEFPEGISYKPKENALEKEIFQSLNLSKEDAKYISIKDADIVRFVFPVKAESIKVGGKILLLDRKAQEGISEAITQFFASELDEGGFNYNDSSGMEHDFYKEFKTVEEAKEAVKWLIDFKKRFGF